MNIAEFRKEYPQYDDVADAELTKTLHEKFYADVPFEKFASSFNPKPAKAFVPGVGWSYSVGDQESGRGQEMGGVPVGGPLKQFTRAFDVRKHSLAGSKWSGAAPWIPGGVGDKFLQGRKELHESRIDPEDEMIVQKFQSEGSMWPVDAGDKWYQINPKRIPETVSTWATYVGDQTAVMLQTFIARLVGKVTGATGAGVVAGLTTSGAGAGTAADIGGKVGGHTFGVAVNIFNETDSFLDDAAFWGITDKSIVEQNARYYGATSGAIEYADYFLKAGPFKAISKLPGIKQAGKLAPALALAAAKELGVNGLEGLTEVSQEGLERHFLRRAAQQMKERNPDFVIPDIPDTFEGAGRTFAAAAGTSFIMRSAGRGAGASMQKLYRDEATKADQLEVNELLNEQEMKFSYSPQLTVTPKADTAPITIEELRIEGSDRIDAKEQEAIAKILEEAGEELSDVKPTEKMTQTERIIAVLEEFGAPVKETGSEQTERIVRELNKMPKPVTGAVKPQLYIGNVTKRAKRAWADILSDAKNREEKRRLNKTDATLRELGLTEDEAGEVTPKDIGPHREGPFPTKRTAVTLNVNEARGLEQHLSQVMDERLEEGGEFTNDEIALLRAMWGDIRNLRSELKLPVGRMPFKIVQSGKTIVAVVPNTTERIYTAIDGPSKKLLADMAPAELVTQEQALEAGLKKVAAAAKKAFSEGSKEAKAAVRAEYRRLAAAKRAITLAKKARKGLVKALTKQVAGTLDPAYRASVQQLSDSVDTSGRSKQTLARMESLQRELTNDPSLAGRIQNASDLRLMRRMGQVSVDQMTTRQLEELVQERARLEDQGRIKSKIENVQRRRKQRQFNGNATAALDNLDDKKLLAPGRETNNATYLRQLKDTLRKRVAEYDYGYDRVDRFMQFLDGYSRGFFTKVWERTKANLHESRERRTVRVKELVKSMKQLGIDAYTWSTDRLPITMSDGTINNMNRWELIGAYVQSHHITGLGHLVNGNQFSADDLKIISFYVENDAQMRAAYEWMIDQQKQSWVRLKDKIRGMGMDPTKYEEIGEYLPLLVQGEDMIDQDDLLVNMLGDFVPEAMLPKGFLIQRKPNASQPVELDALALYLHSVDQTEHFMAMAPMLQKLGSLFADKEFVKTLNSKTYSQGADILVEWAKSIGRDRIVHEHNFVNDSIQFLQRNSGLYAIGWNVVSVLKQAPALLVGLATDARMITKLIPNAMLLADVRQFNALHEFANEKSKVLKHRNVEYELRSVWNKAQLQGMMKREFVGGKPELSQRATSWMRKVDDWFATLAWKCKYDVVMEETGGDEASAVRLADEVVQSTQQMASPEDLPHLFKAGALAATLHVFQNQSNQEWNFLKHDIYGRAKAGKLTSSQIAWRVMVGRILPAALFMTLSTGAIGDEPEEDNKNWLVKGMIAYQLGNIPILGMVADAAIGKGLGGQLWQTPLQGASQVVAGARSGDLWTASKGMLRIAAGGLPMKGLINTQQIRTLEGAYDLFTGETDDYRRLIWSKSMLEMGKGT